MADGGPARQSPGSWPTADGTYSCDEHGFYTKDPKLATKHIQGHLIDEMFSLAASLLKKSIGIPPFARPDPALCHCWALPYPHQHVGKSKTVSGFF